MYEHRAITQSELRGPRKRSTTDGQPLWDRDVQLATAVGPVSIDGIDSQTKRTRRTNGHEDLTNYDRCACMFVFFVMCWYEPTPSQDVGSARSSCEPNARTERGSVSRDAATGQRHRPPPRSPSPSMSTSKSTSSPRPADVSVDGSPSFPRVTRQPMAAAGSERKTPRDARFGMKSFRSFGTRSQGRRNRTVPTRQRNAYELLTSRRWRFCLDGARNLRPNSSGD